MIVGGVVVGLAAVAFAAFWFGQRSFYYFPDAADPGPAEQTVAGGEDVELHTADGLALRAWLVRPAAPGDGAPDAAEAMAVLYLPGNGGNRAGRAGAAEAMAAQGFATLLVDYRGYGGNPGAPTEEGLALDAEAAADWLADHGFPPQRTIYLGESLGTGVATRLAVERPPAGLVLRSPYTNFGEVAELQMGGLPLGALIRDRYDTLDTIPEVTSPVMVLAGEADTLIPVAQSEAVAAAAPNLAALVIEPGRDHNDPLWFGPYLAERTRELADLAGR